MQQTDSYRKDIFVEIKKLKDKTGKRMRGQGVFDRDEYVYKKHKELYFDLDVKRLKGAKIES